MDWNSFVLGFWHPFGSYCGLTVQDILAWKQDEAIRIGWTLWSFAYTSSAGDWHALLKDHTGPVHVLCSHSPAARDPKPAEEQQVASHFRGVLETDWKPRPDRKEMFVPNPFKRGGLATAFVVRRVNVVPPNIPPVGVNWYARSEGRWRDGPLPTRGKFLIRRGTARLRSVAAVLELQSPYLAILRSGVAASDLEEISSRESK